MYAAVTAMKYINRFLPFIARPIVQLIGDHEVIACGLMLENEASPVIIYSPSQQRDHWFVNKRVNNKKHQPAGQRTKLIGDLIVYQAVPEAALGDIYQVRAYHNTNGRLRISPDIHIKMQTDVDNNLISTEENTEGTRIDWRVVPQHYQAMIYFIGIEDKNGEGICGIYTRETELQVPSLKQMALYLPGQAGKLQSGQVYVAHLFVVDYEGWVPLRSSTQFTFGSI